MDDQGRVECRGYGPGFWFKPFLILPLEEGRKRWKHIQAEKGDYEEKHEKLKSEAYARVKKVLGE